MTNEELAIKQHLSKPRPESDACGCLGPQGDDPFCPCRMPWCEQVNGIWYQIQEQRSPDGIKLIASEVLTKERTYTTADGRTLSYTEAVWKRN